MANIKLELDYISVTIYENEDILIQDKETWEEVDITKQEFEWILAAVAEIQMNKNWSIEND